MLGTANQKLSASPGGTIELFLGSEISRILRRPLAVPNLAGVCFFSGLTIIPYNDPEPHTKTLAKE
jgi:hypothetical protein